jgi:hypothetical protein
MSYLHSLGYTHAYRYPGGIVVACGVENCLGCRKPMMTGVGHLEEYRSLRATGLKVLRTLLPEEGDKNGVCEHCSPFRQPD